jgi:Aspartyl protease
MGKALLLLCCSCLTAADVSQLQRLNENHRFFDLRRAIEQPGWNPEETFFYRGVIACRFGQENAGIELLRSFLAASIASPMARNAHEEIAEAFERLNRYRDAAREWTEWLRLTPKDDPEREGAENKQALLDSLSDVPPESILIGLNVPVRATRNRVGTWDVPVEINGVTSKWIFDTGANVSTLAQSEAKRMGLTIRESKAWARGSTGQKNPLQIAVADTLRCGSVQVHNVVLLVLTDQALNISPLHYQISGILGLPLLRSLGRIGFAKTGEVLMPPSAPATAGLPNLYFDGESPMLEVDHNQHHLQMFLDTGANATVLYPSFRNALSSGEQSRLHHKREGTAGAGGAILQQTRAVVPTLSIDLLGKSIDLKKISLLPDAPPDGRYRDGVIGMDALWSGFLLDFAAMRLQPAR